ncbi:helicase [Bacillus sp. SA1-12]|uniref:RNA polymerase recycling motor HelD n=1 Tax=Bacillus sp. SA1-12 TaxID=1455638 RepID=UPI000626FE73|nr:RNA polymerase recycling motor HelD [Bacillus sp. SA1-12]KKI90211.1 helicase [Bacillus sp. SA1-12]
MDHFEKEQKAEQLRMNLVVNKIKTEMSSITKHTSDVKTDIVTIRKNFWEDVTVNLDDAVEVTETAASIKQQAEFLSEQEHRHRHLIKNIKNLKRLIDAPYFARIDFSEEGESQVENIYIGTATYHDHETDEFLVYDWRAPISSMYYDFGPGPAEFIAPGGIVSGEILLKRQFIVRNAHIDGMFDTGITIGDELLQEVLGKQSNSQMKTIVATIQQEQNKVIRNEKGKLLVVQGAAGSGKTSAALQRIAYLLYKYRNTLISEEILLFSPNPMFNSYIRNVLPELGEENMQQSTFQQYLQYSLGDTYTVEDPFSQLEYLLTAEKDNDYIRKLETIKYKSSFFYLNLIENYLSYLGNQGLIFQDVIFRDEILFCSDAIYSYFYSLSNTLSITNRMKLVSEWMLGEIKKAEKNERKKDWVEEEIQFLSKEEYQHYFQKLSKQKRFSQDTFDDFDREEEMLSKYVVKRHFQPVKRLIRNLGFINLKAIYLKLFEIPLETLMKSVSLDLSVASWKEICKNSVQEISQNKLPYEDATPFLYLKERIEGFKVNTSVKYVFIDEAQDYSAFQFAFLKNLFPNARFTVLGDLNQAIYTHESLTNIEELKSLFTSERTEIIKLNRSYRSTRQIVEFTRAFMKNGNEIVPFNRDGIKPVLISGKNKEEIIKAIVLKVRLLESYKSISIICKSASESEEAYELLRKHIPVNLVDKRSNEFGLGVVIIPSYLAKGIEFDAVIIFDGSKSKYGHENVRKLFYTVCTRAMHELFVFYKDEVTPFIAEIPTHLYIEET